MLTGSYMFCQPTFWSLVLGSNNVSFRRPTSNKSENTSLVCLSLLLSVYFLLCLRDKLTRGMDGCLVWKTLFLVEDTAHASSDTICKQSISAKVLWSSRSCEGLAWCWELSLTINIPRSGAYVSAESPLSPFCAPLLQRGGAPAQISRHFLKGISALYGLWSERMTSTPRTAWKSYQTVALEWVWHHTQKSQR